MIQTRKSFFSFSLWPEDIGLLKAEKKHRPHPVLSVLPSLGMPFPIGDDKDSVNHFEGAAMNDLERQKKVFERMKKPPHEKDDPMSDARMQHSANVAHIIGHLCLTHPKLGLDPHEGWMAGALHDLFGESRLKDDGTKGSRKANPKWFWQAGGNHHGPLAALMAETAGVDSDWADAIRHHSTGTHSMTPHMKIMLLADSITPDRGDSPQLRRLRAAALKNPHDAAAMMATALHNAIIHGHDAKELRSGVPYNPFMPDREALRAFRVAGRGHPPHPAILSGAPNGVMVRLHIENPHVRHILSSGLRQSDEEGGEGLATWLTAPDRVAGLFRNALSAVWPILHDRLKEHAKEADDKSNGKSKEVLRNIAIQSKMMNAGSDDNVHYLVRHFDPEWLNGHEGKHPFRQKDTQEPIRIKTKRMQKSAFNAERLLPKSLRHTDDDELHFVQRILPWQG